MADTRTLAVLTTGRQDFGILRESLRLLAADVRFRLRLLVGGMHLQSRFGMTVEMVRAEGLEIARELAFLHEPPDEAADFARAAQLVGDALRLESPDAVLLVGDRSETLAAAAAATLRRIPIAHLHGGEESEGAIDNACRHAITKLSHLHLVSHEAHASRVRQMGEADETIVVVGAPGLDNLYRDDLPGRAELAKYLSHSLPDPVVLVTVHPTTLSAGASNEVVAIGEAMADLPATYVVTAPNADSGGNEIREYWSSWSKGRSNAVFTDALGERAYWGLMREAHVVLGNSSSGIIEAPAAGAAVVNVGDRQRGRLRYGHVVDVPAESGAIRRALESALAARRPGPGAAGYPSGAAAPRVVGALAGWEIPRPPRKRFRDLQCRP